ncbi:PREDICTED: granulocyte-macrophage colony-stimulating factor receptor subunit alpha-like [Elephantulus edwardii]|uniref:granulocyte-macrophage colony-stimulating factor receptor subunit alpha-like n=1 Tax=Elephantulus edwardii TaxID=28737 RepID=UPI0003F097E7|nr:PREDICTED: granulocyte-macrophage colony-stimulating factor receptor subunit alpha-like [Elephantulus edwardii]
MGTQGRVVLFSLFLTRTGLLALGPQDLSTVEPVPTLNLSFDARTWTLAWVCVDNITVLNCTMLHREYGPVTEKPLENQCSCEFKDYPLHRGALFIVNASLGHRWFKEELEYTNPGTEGTAAANFSCFILDEDFMNCTWTRGQWASDEVQYFLYIRGGEDTEVECPHYIDDRGTHVGCHIHHLLGSYSDFYFLVNGTSPESKIPFFDAFLTRSEMQMYRPPTNISVTCNRTHCLVTWERPSTQKLMSTREQDFDVDIRSKGSPDSDHSEIKATVSGDEGDMFSFPISPRTSYMVRIRAANSRTEPQRWGAWSQPVGFGLEEQEPHSAYIYILVVLGTLSVALSLWVLCKRSHLLHNLFPPIPKIKDKIRDGQQVNWAAPPLNVEKLADKEVLTIVEEFS